MSKQLKWPGLLISEADRQIALKIKQCGGVLKGVDTKDLLMISASIAVKEKLPVDASLSAEKLDRQISHPTLMNKPEYEEFRQYIAFLFFLSKGNKDISSLNDASLMVKNFVNLAQRGLRYLEVNYVNEKTGSDDLMDNFLNLLSEIKNQKS